jgi:peptidyl-prolyl cis-trans isomerase SurA
MVQRNGDEAIIRHILLIPPITDEETNAAISRLDTARSKVIAGTMSFNAAALKYSEDDQSKFSGPMFTGTDGSTFVRIDQLDKEIVPMLAKMKTGEFSQPVLFTDERGTKAVRFIYLKSRTEPHRMNLRDDYNKISTMALEEKKAQAMDKWLKDKLPNYYIMVSSDFTGECSTLEKYISKKSY